MLLALALICSPVLRAQAGPDVLEYWVPSDSLKRVLEAEPRAVLLPRDQVEALIRDGSALLRRSGQPPVGAVSRSIEYKGRIEGGVAVFDAEMTVHNPGDGWVRVPFDFSGAAVTRISVGKGGVVARPAPKKDAPGGWSLLLGGRGEHKIQLTLQTEIQPEAGSSLIEWTGPLAEVARCQLTLPPGVRVVPLAGQSVATTPAAVTVALAPSASAAQVSVRWLPAQSAGKATFHVQGALKVGIGADAVRGVWQLRLRAPLGRLPEALTLSLPATAQVARISGRDVARWSADGAGYRIEFAPEATQEAEFELAFEQPSLDGAAQGTARIPVPEIPSAGRFAASIRLEAKNDVRVRKLDPALSFSVEETGGRFVATATASQCPTGVEIALARVTPRFVAELDTRVMLTPEEITIQRTANIRPEEGEIFHSDLALPAAEQLLAVTDSKNKPLEWTPTGGGKIRVLWPSGGAAARTIHLLSRLELAGWRTLSGGEINVPVGMAAIENAAVLTGYVAVAADDSFRIEARASETLERRDARRTPVQGSLAWFWRAPYTLEARVSRRAAEIQAEVTGYALPHDGVLELRAQLAYAFLHSGVRQVRVRVPDAVAQSLHFDGPEIAERRYADGVWTIVFQKELRGGALVGVSGKIPLNKSAEQAGKFSAEIPVIVPLDTQRVAGRWGIEANTETELAIAPRGMSELDLSEAPGVAGYEPQHRLVGVYSWLGEGYELKLTGTRHAPFDLPTLHVDSFALNSVLSTSGRELTKAVISLRSSSTQFLNLELPPAASVLTLEVDGGAVKPVRGLEQEIRVRLPAKSQIGEPTYISLTYEITGNEWRERGDVRLTPPKLAGNTSVGVARWSVALPPGFQAGEYKSNLPRAVGNSNTPDEAQVRSQKWADPIRRFEFRRIEGGSGAFDKGLSKHMDGEFGRPAVAAAAPAAKPATSVAAAPQPAEQPALPAVQLSNVGASAAPAQVYAGKLFFTEKAKATGILPLKIELPEAGETLWFYGTTPPGPMQVGYESLHARGFRAWMWAAGGVLAFVVFGLRRPILRTAWVALALGCLLAAFETDALVVVGGLGAGWAAAFGLRLALKFTLLRRGLAVWLAAALAVTTTGFAEETKPANDKAAGPLKLFVPYDAARPVRGQNPDRVYVPLNDYQALTEASRRAGAGLPTAAVGEKFAVNWARYDGQWTPDGLRFEAVFELASFDPAPVAVPMSFAGAVLREVQLNGAATGFSNGALVLPRAGVHQARVTFDVPGRAPQRAWKWSVPPCHASLITFSLPDKKMRANVDGATAVIEREEADRRTLVAALNASGPLGISLSDWGGGEKSTAPGLATTTTQTRVSREAELTTVAVTFDEFQTSDGIGEFALTFDAGLLVERVEAEGLRGWLLAEEGGRQKLTLHLAQPARQAFTAKLALSRLLKSAEGTAPRVVPVARRVESTTALVPAGRDHVSVLPGEGLRQVSGSSGGDGVVAVYSGAGELRYRVSAPEPKREARLSSVYQVQRRRVEFITRIELSAHGDDVDALSLTLPEGFSIENLSSPRLTAWWQEERRLFMRLGGATPEQTDIVLHLVRDHASAPRELELVPLRLDGCRTVSGSAVIAAHTGEETRLTVSGAQEEPPDKVATEFEVSAPLERKRAFSFKTPEFSGKVSLERIAPETAVLWAMQAVAGESFASVHTRARLAMVRGSVDAVTFSLPEAAPIARVSGSEVRETRMRLEGGRRSYEVHFQNDVTGTVDFDFALDLPAVGEMALPAPVFAGAKTVRGYIITDNASDSALTLSTRGVEVANESELPWLPERSNFAKIWRASDDWAVSLTLERFEKEAGRTAFCAWAELNTQLRDDGEVWTRAVWRMQNRTLQFLPVRLPDGAEVLSARVAGEPSRVDRGEVAGQAVLLVPLIRTKPGDLSYDVEMIYRQRGKSAGWQGRVGLDDPDLPGITIEKTIWKLSLPTGATLWDASGNLEQVVAEVAEVEQLESELAEVKALAGLVSSARSQKDNDYINRNRVSLAEKVQEKINTKLSMGRKAYVKKAEQTQDEWAVDKAAKILSEVTKQSVEAKNAVQEQITQQRVEAVARGAEARNFTGGNWAFNGRFGADNVMKGSGQVLFATNEPAQQREEKDVQFTDLNEGVVLRQKQAVVSATKEEKPAPKAKADGGVDLMFAMDGFALANEYSDAPLRLDVGQQADDWLETAGRKQQIQRGNVERFATSVDKLSDGTELAVEEQREQAKYNLGRQGGGNRLSKGKEDTFDTMSRQDRTGVALTSGGISVGEVVTGTSTGTSTLSPKVGEKSATGATQSWDTQAGRIATYQNANPHFRGRAIDETTQNFFSANVAGATRMTLGGQSSLGLQPSGNAAVSKPKPARFESRGRVSLPVSLELSGEPLHFKKVKSGARLEVRLSKTSSQRNWWVALWFAVGAGGLLVCERVRRWKK